MMLFKSANNASRKKFFLDIIVAKDDNLFRGTALKYYNGLDAPASFWKIKNQLLKNERNTP